ncbi:MAG TPA: DUF4238 domain-containing protein [bacterium]
MDRKRRHHHVWQEYLRSWESEAGIFCLQDGRIFSTGTRSVAIEKDFYRFYELDAEDIQIILDILKGEPEESENPHDNETLQLFLTPLLWLQSTGGVGHDGGKIKQLQEQYLSEAFENLHQTIESAFLPILRELLVGGVGFYRQEKESNKFFIFMCVQYMRTIGPRVRAIQHFRKTTGRDLTKIWSFLCYRLAIRLAGNLASERDKRPLLLMHNNTDIPFVTGDQPLINLFNTGPEQVPTHFAIYYPLSPKLALVLNEIELVHPFTSESPTQDQITGLNSLIFKNAFRQVFGHSRESLLTLEGAQK